MEVDFGIIDPLHVPRSQNKRRKFSAVRKAPSLPCHMLPEVEASLPVLRSSDYYMKPCLGEIASREFFNPGYCSEVQDFTVGRSGYGRVKFFGVTDVRKLELDNIIKFSKHEVVVYEDETSKPAVGQGLNKPAEVTLLLQIQTPQNCCQDKLKGLVEKLKLKTEKQGAQFISFDALHGEWKFLVQHFSRFGLNEDDEEDIAMEDVTADVQDPAQMNGGEISDIDEETAFMDPVILSHSLPAHLGLDPIKMKEMRMLMFPADNEKEDDFDGIISHQGVPLTKDSSRSLLRHSSRRTVQRSSPLLTRKTPLALIEYNHGSFSSNSPESVLMAQQNKGFLLRATNAEGFRLDLEHRTPVTESHSHNIVDAALFMGRSFRVGWGPNGVLVHSGAPVNASGSRKVLSSVINLEKVAIDNVVRDDNDKVREELAGFCFDFPLNLHKGITHETKEVAVGSSTLKLQKLVCNSVLLPEICRNYIEIVENQLEVPGLSSASRVLLMHQVLVWELIKVLFSSRQMSHRAKPVDIDNEVDMSDGSESAPEVDSEALPLIRRAEFSYWLQESVCHKVQEEIGSLSESSHLQHLFLLLTGRQLDAAVELAASRGDVRLACLLSQAGGSSANRADIARQLDLWRNNGLDFNFIEEDRVRLLELLAGNIHDALHGIEIDWKRFLGLLMWYQLGPETSLPIVFRTYQQLLNDGKAPSPVPVYIDEGPVDKFTDWGTGKHFDLAYYLMLLHANQENGYGALKTMFSAFASTYDPLDYHMIWHQRAVLEAVGTFSSNDLHLLDIGLVSQLLCLGKIQWAIYVVLHMPYREDYPYIQPNLIKEILFQYCEVWSNDESQRQFIEDLGIPLAWLHEALAIYFSYYQDYSKALEHFIECGNWQKAHAIFMTSVAHHLFLSAKESEIWTLASLTEDHKEEIEDWDLGAGIYISFYSLRRSLQEDGYTMTQLDTLENKNDACADFFNRLNESLAVWASRLAVEARLVYSKMAEEISNLLLSDSGEASTHEVQLSCFDTVFEAPLPEDLRSCHLQDVVSVFTSYLSEIAS